MMSLLVGLGMVINFDTTSDCGMAKAALNIMQGKDKNYFTEFGLESEASLLHKFRMELENFEHGSIDFKPLVDDSVLKKVSDLEESLNSWNSTLSNSQIEKCDGQNGTFDHPLEKKIENFNGKMI